jgi:LacI family transcriptional regulator
MVTNPRSPGTAASATSVQDVAKAAGVSRATAARVLGRYGSVSERSRRAVEAAAERLGYSVNTIARSMATGRTRTFGGLISDLSNPFFARVMRGFSDRARASGYDVMITNTDETPDREWRALQVLIEKRVDGIVAAPASALASPALEQVIARGTPVVQIDRYIETLATDRVVVDNYQAALSAVGRVLAAGHKLIAAPAQGPDPATGRTEPLTTMGQRHRGYLDAVKAAGLELPAGYAPPANTRADVARQVGQLLASQARPSAVFGLDDSFMLGIIDAIRAERLEIGPDISVFGFDDTDWTTVVSPPLSVISQPAYELGAKAAELLEARIDNPSRPLEHCELLTTWIERESIRSL